MALEVAIKNIILILVLDVKFFTLKKEFLGVLGASGCGKSVTLKMYCRDRNTR